MRYAVHLLYTTVRGAWCGKRGVHGMGSDAFELSGKAKRRGFLRVAQTLFEGVSKMLRNYFPISQKLSTLRYLLRCFDELLSLSLHVLGIYALVHRVLSQVR